MTYLLKKLGNWNKGLYFALGKVILKFKFINLWFENSEYSTKIFNNLLKISSKNVNFLSKVSTLKNAQTLSYPVWDFL